MPFPEAMLRRRHRVVECITLILVLSCGSFGQKNAPQQLSGLDRDRAIAMWDMASDDVKRYYYDPTFHGVDWDATIRSTRQKIESSPSLNIALAHIAGAFESLNDSHAFFIPPSRPYKHDYGFELQMIGEHCFVTRVRPRSDAEAKGLHAGDEILNIEGILPTRDNLWKLLYVFNTLQPRVSLRLSLRSPAGAEHPLEVMAKMRSTGMQVKDLGGSIGDLVRESEDARQLLHYQTVEVGDLEILKAPIFFFADSVAVDMVSKARKHGKGLIIDLRSNPGGAVDSLKSLLDVVFDHEVKIGDRIRRNGKKELVAKSHHNPFTGKIVVLVDSKSASASEVFARIVQIEKRGQIIGDRTAGAVMEALTYVHHTGFSVVAFFADSVTDADLVMTDGKSLEHVGVTPDEIVIPTAADLAAGRDPAMSRAAEVLGFQVTPEQAGKFFPYQWPKD